MHPNTAHRTALPWQYRNNRILIVDDQPELHDDFVEMLAPSAPPRASDDLAAAFQAADGSLDPAPAAGPLPPPFELSHAYSGEDACTQVEEAWREGRPFALAFVDLRMPPEMDGVEAIRRIRRTDRNLEIVVMTACSERSPREIVSGIDPLHKMLHVRKPFTREEIQQIAMCMVGKWNVERALAARSHQITANNRTLAAVLDATEDAMAMFDESGRLVLANRRFERISGLAREEMTEMSGEALAGKLRRRFREPETGGVKSGFEANGTDDLVEGVGPKWLRGPFYRSRVAVRGADGAVVGRLEVYRAVSKDTAAQRRKGEAKMSYVVQVESLPRRLTEAEASRTPPGNGTPQKPCTLAVIEAEVLAHYRKVAEDRIAKVAKILGIRPSTLRRKIRQHGLKMSASSPWMNLREHRER